MSAVPILDSAVDLMRGYDVVFCDVWGVVHNGATAYVEGCRRLAEFRAGGGTVILVTNAPRTADVVANVLADKDVPWDCWDAIVSSGEVAAAHVAQAGFRTVHHIGPDRDLDLFAKIAASRVDVDGADALVVTGLIHDHVETGEDYRARLQPAVARRLPFVCANPDLIVDVGGTLLPCAGAIATVYENMGGAVFWAGKPHPYPYRMAQAIADDVRGGPTDKARILAIGDAIRTDIAGAIDFGIDALFIGQGIHRDEVMPAGVLDRARFDGLLAKAPHRPIAGMSTLR